MRLSVIKSGKGHPIEDFDSQKLHSSIYAACLSLRTPEGQADEIAQQVVVQVKKWAENKTDITSADIRRIGADALKRLHPEAEYLYRQQLTVI